MRTAKVLDRAGQEPGRAPLRQHGYALATAAKRREDGRILDAGGQTTGTRRTALRLRRQRTRQQLQSHRLGRRLPPQPDRRDSPPPGRSP